MDLNRLPPLTSGFRPAPPPDRNDGPVLERADSLPARLPSNPAPRTEVKPERKPITRAKPDANPPQDFSRPPAESPTLFGFSLGTEKRKQNPEAAKEERIREGAIRKKYAMQNISDSKGYMPDILGDPEYMDVIKAYHPRFDGYPLERKLEAIKVLNNHPRFVAGMAETRNEVSRLPNGPTAARKMEPDEQLFLTRAFRELGEDFRKNPFHIHGETAVVGNRRGEITQMNYSPESSSSASIAKGDQYHLHTHPPFGEPFDSSASSQDQKLAAELYTLHDNKMGTYVTNGRDVLHIQPHSTELVKLIPDPELEKEVGKFPAAFTVPEPQRPPRPFSNHEAP